MFSQVMWDPADSHWIPFWAEETEAMGIAFDTKTIKTRHIIIQFNLDILKFNLDKWFVQGTDLAVYAVLFKRIIYSLTSVIRGA